jgi:hypothetical protein
MSAERSFAGSPTWCSIGTARADRLLRVLHAARLTQGYSDLRPGHGDHERSPDRRSGHLFRVVSEPGAER